MQTKKMSFSEFEKMSHEEMRGIMAGSGTLVSTPSISPNPFIYFNLTNFYSMFGSYAEYGGSGSYTYTAENLISALWNYANTLQDVTVSTSYKTSFGTSFDGLQGGYQITEGVGIQGIYNVSGNTYFVRDQYGNLTMNISGGFNSVSDIVSSNSTFFGSVDIYINGYKCNSITLDDPRFYGPTIYQTGNIPFTGFSNLGNLSNGTLIQLVYNTGYLYNDGSGNIYNSRSFIQLIRVGVGSVLQNNYNIPVVNTGR
jgi:hypothetical protein